MYHSVPPAQLHTISSLNILILTKSSERAIWTSSVLTKKAPVNREHLPASPALVKGAIGDGSYQGWCGSTARPVVAGKKRKGEQGKSQKVTVKGEVLDMISKRGEALAATSTVMVEGSSSILGE
jgi:hypothetical protein